MNWTEIDALCKKIELITQNINQSSTIALFGAGPYGVIASQYLRAQGFNNLIFIDNNSSKQGLVIEGIPIFSIECVLEKKPAIILITARHAVNIIKEQLKNCPVIVDSFDAFFVGKNIDRLKNTSSKAA